ncbi:MAG: hypothetical protein ABSD71_08405 [Bacteroidales bacterium]|jgi:hypothetical protein
MKTKVTIAAKQTILIVLLSLGLQVNHIMAKSPSIGSPSKNISDVPASINTANSSSSTDVASGNKLILMNLVPIVPKEALFNDFENPVDLNSDLLKSFAPVVPDKYEINDSTLENEVNLNSLKFTVPLQANFEDL